MGKTVKKILIVAILTALSMPYCYAVDDTNNTALSLKDCISKALNNSPMIKRAKINYEMAKKNIRIAQSVYFPTVSAGVGYDFSNREGSKINSTTTNGFNAKAGISQLIWNFGKSSANIKMQKFNKIVAAYDFDTMVLDTIFNVKVKYYSTLASKAAIEIDKTNLHINERNYQRTKAFFEEGLKSKIDLVNSEVYVTDAKVSLIGAENEGLNGLQITVYYSENNWETCEEVNLILDDSTTFNQLIDSAVYKFKTELFYDNIDKKQFNVMLFKKKKKMPNDEYPICNSESKVKDYGKNHFCLVEDINSKKEDNKNESKDKEVNTDKNKDTHNKNKENDINTNVTDKKDEKEIKEKFSEPYKKCKPICISCNIF